MKYLSHIAHIVESVGANGRNVLTGAMLKRRTHPASHLIPPHQVWVGEDKSACGQGGMLSMNGGNVFMRFWLGAIAIS
jgi:hypothetical protein